jgi:hypothetical protein
MTRSICHSRAAHSTIAAALDDVQQMSLAHISRGVHEVTIGTPDSAA